MKQKITNKVDLEKTKNELRNAINDRDPFQKWLPILNELKSELDDAKSKNISVNQMRKILVSSGIKVPNDVLKKFLDLRKK